MLRHIPQVRVCECTDSIVHSKNANVFRRKKANQTEKAFGDPITRVNGEVQDVEPVVKALVGSAWETDVEQHGVHSVPLAADQLEGLPKSSIHPCEAGSKLKNRTKNRFADIKPFDATRVVLESDDTSHSDYINANYISGYKDVEKHYIATQGPKASTVVDFWRLLWQEKVNRIVMAKAEEEVDVFSCVQQMQMQRMNMIQDLEQYVFVYEALLEALKSGETAIPCTEFPRTLKNIEDHNSAAHQQMCKEFELIRTYKDAIDLTNADGGKVKNRSKNRYQDIVPMDLFRHRLDPRVSEHNDYINAVSVDGYRSLNAFLLTQMPLPETVSNFLHMIYSSDGIQSNVIVMLNALDEEVPSCASYWPNDVGSPVEHGGLRVDLVQEDADQHPNIFIRDLTISTAGGEDPKPLKVRQFQLINCWSKDRSFPKDEKVLLTLMELVTRWQQQSGVAPVTVHCTNGVERSALFAIASYLMDMLKAEQVVDVYLASRFITSKCPLALPLLEQYQFLFELAGSFMSNFETYANFK
ncbi:hypothetical protein CAPTEDRAFT_211728 [Capitella teleta]|uniref:protein-tyrosine-phosphatase n=1 Tax=Capitella teleta TaxID=283909 RepID=R7U6F7_CAPTE|nr:hypothetical protein CAPTEDRAFT_211728 [Capitella teleta]|eukprot:ELU01915.1 hypothetical protein CAPTEDRAFT_211728 [Capitella teleta]